MAGLTALSDILNMLVSVYCLIMIWMDILLRLEHLLRTSRLGIDSNHANGDSCGTSLST